MISGSDNDGLYTDMKLVNMLIDTLKNRKVCETEWAWAMRARNEIANKWIKLIVCF
jgi:hypothetical protein